MLSWRSRFTDDCVDSIEVLFSLVTHQGFRSSPLMGEDRGEGVTIPEGHEPGKTMQDSGATEKRTCLPTAGVRVGWARTCSAISPHRITTSAELPRKVTRSTIPAPVFVPLFDGLFRSKNSTYSGRKNKDAGNPSRHSTLRLATKTPSGDSTSISSQACIPLLLTCTGTKLDVPRKSAVIRCAGRR